MFKPYFNTKENYHRFREDIKIANGYCLNCQKPLTHRHMYCSGCIRNKLFIDGFEGSRVTFGDVGIDTIPFQQFLHRSIFDCNVFVDYRGKKEDRLKAKISKKTLNRATIRLNKALSCAKYTYNNKEYFNNKHNREIYMQVKDVRNIQNRLIYNTLLYYISYHLNNNTQFKTFVPFQTSMLHNLLINVENTHIRVNRPENRRYYNQKRKSNKAKYWYWLFEEVDSIIEPLLYEVIDSINK